MSRYYKYSKKKVFIIAEAGVNHNGDSKIARKMIDAAINAGADAVKFQTFKPEEVISKFAFKADYQKKTTDKDESPLEMAKKLELGIDEHKSLVSYCRKKRIIFLSSPFDLWSVDLLNSLGLKILKIPSGEITNLPYLRKIGSLHKKIILSTGMSYLKEVKQAVNALVLSGTPKKDITILHCTTEYPSPFADINLLAMVTMRDNLGIKVGYSDHSLGVEIPIAAVALGATIIEKHFTLDRNMKGPDHAISLEPHELKAMVCAIRNVEKALGNGIKQPSLSEMKNMIAARKSIVARRTIRKGEIFNQETIAVKRPGSGTSPMLWDRIVHKIAKRDFEEDEMIYI